MPKLTKREQEELRAEFSKFDLDGNGAISIQELRTVMIQMGMNPTEEEVKAMIHAHDKDGSDQIEFPEFCEMMAQQFFQQDVMNEAKAAFDMFDTDGSGKISREELKLCMQKLGERLTEEDIDKMIQEADVDGDGEINYEEFLEMMCGGSGKK